MITRYQHQPLFIHCKFTIDIDQAVDFRTASRYRNPFFPAQRAVIKCYGYNGAIGESGDDKRIDNQRRTVAAQGKRRHCAFIYPEFRTIVCIEASQLAIDALGDNNLSIGDRSRQYFAGYLRLPQNFPVIHVQRNDFGVFRTHKHQAIAGAYTASNIKIETGAPKGSAIVAIDSDYYAVITRRVNSVACHHGVQPVEFIALP